MIHQDEVIEHLYKFLKPTENSLHIFPRRKIKEIRFMTQNYFRKRNGWRLQKRTHSNAEDYSSRFFLVLANEK